MLNKNKNHVELFWQWFSKTSDDYFHFERNQKTLFQKLKYELDKIDPNLVFEFSPVLEDKKREFVISADGIISSFPSVSNLVKNAPTLEKWNIIAFRQPHKQVEQICYQGLLLKFEDVFFKYTKNKGKIDLELFIRGFYESAEWTALAFILLDNILGEYDAEMYLNCIDKRELNMNEIDSLFPISTLPEFLNDYKLEFNN